jgi:allantoinase
MRLLVSNGTLATASGCLRADVYCVDGRIAALLAPGEAVQADERVEATGLLVFPGFVDPHVHSRDPGLTHKEDFAHSTLGALVGGVTTVLEMPNAIPPVSDVATFRDRAAHHGRVAWVDFGLWGLSLGSENLGEIAGLFAEGAVGVKLFWGYALRKDTKQLVYNLADEPLEKLLLPPDNGEVLEVFRAVSRVGGLMAAHCEDRHLLEAAQRDLGHDIESYDDLLAARPDTAEAASIALAVEFSRATGCRFHVVHMASARGVQLVRSAQREGIPVTAETCPQYLTLTDEAFKRVGPIMKVYPPIRRANDQQALWEGVRDGTIVSVGSDHAPHTIEEKQRGLASQPAGMVGVETLAPVMLNEMAAGRLTPERLAWVLSESTARLYGIYPHNGGIRPGGDADLTLVDPTATRTISNDALHAKQPVSPWNGVTVTGVPTLSVLRGEVIMRDGEPVGEPRGRLVRALWAGDGTGGVSV